MKNYKVSIYGYGAEVTIGSVNNEQKEILNNPERELNEIASDDLEDFGGWYEIDDQYHRWGAAGEWTLLVEDENGETFFELVSKNISDFDTDDFELSEFESIEVDESLDLLMCVSFEKGSFFEGSIITEDDFDISKLQIKIDDEVGISEFYFGSMISSITYDGEEIDNYGGSTDSKSFEVYKNF